MSEDSCLPILTTYFLLPILTSIIASIIFWYVFSHKPYKNKYSKIRPKVEMDIYDIYIHLLFYFDTIFACKPYSTGDYQQKIKAGILTLYDFKLWLHGKCLNETYLFDENKSTLMPIGSRLKQVANEVSERVEALMKYYEFITPDEILILQKIVKKLNVYDYEDDAGKSLGDSTYYPVNPTISYMANNIMEIYKLYICLRDTIYKFKYLCKNLDEKYLPNTEVMKIQDLYYAGKYNTCAELLQKAKNTDQLKWIDFMCTYKLGKTDVAKAKLIELLKCDRTHLVYLRSGLSIIMNDTDMLSTISELRPNDEVEHWRNVVFEEEEIIRTTIGQNERLIRFYEDKDKRS